MGLLKVLNIIYYELLKQQHEIAKIELNRAKNAQLLLNAAEEGLAMGCTLQQAVGNDYD